LDPANIHLKLSQNKENIQGRETMKSFRIILVVFLLLTNVELSPAQGFSREQFSNPPIQFWPRPLWFWNNTTVQTEEVEKQMVAFRDSCGYGGFGILPFGKKFKPEYLSEEYFKVYGKALEKAKELGLTMCLYDEFGFPSGGAGAVNGDDIPRFALKYPTQTIKRLDKIEAEVNGPVFYNCKIPDGALMGIVAMETKTLQRIDLTAKVTEGELKWNVLPGNWKIMIFMCVKDGDPILDYLNPEAVRNFIEMTHEAYYEHFKEYFGTVISGTFFDEPTMYRANGRMWTEAYNLKFKGKYGFSPVLLYPALWYDIGNETQSARNYLFGFRTELYAEGFTKEVNDWSIAHGITATGHQDNEELKNPVGTSGDLMKCFKYLDIPGVDKIGGNRPAEDFYKIISSSAYNWDKPFVMSETYGAMGNLSWNEMISVAMDQYSKGINMLIPHAVWYDNKNVTFKPELSQRNPIYRDSLKIFNLFLSRLNVILQNKGRHVADIAVLYPISSLQGEHYFDGPLGFYKGGVDIPKTDYVDVAKWLTNYAGKDFTFLHPEVLDEKCQIANKKLHLQNAANWEDFQVLVIPSCKTISVSNLQKIKSFYDQGGKVIFTTQLPSMSVEKGKGDEILRIIKSIFVEGNQQSTNNKGGKAYFIASPDGAEIREALEQTGINYDVDYPLNENLRYLHKNTGERDIFYFANIGGSSINTAITLRGSYNPEIWDPHSGLTISSASTHFIAGNKNKTIIQLELQPFHSCFLIQDTDKKYKNNTN
jgi:hypothetical protein